MSSALGYPDWQQIQQWLGAPIASQTGYAIDAGAKVEGPFNLSSWASVIIAVKPTGGTITLTVSQSIAGGPPGLVLATQFVIPAGQTVFEAVVLYGDVLNVTLQGSAVGETVDYAIYPSNTTTNAQVLATATVNVQKAGALVAAEPTLDFLDGLGIKITATDDPTNTRVLLTINQAAIADSLLLVAAASVDVQNIPATYAALRHYFHLRGTDPGTLIGLNWKANNDAGANYDAETLYGAGAAPNANNAAATVINLDSGVTPGAGATAGFGGGFAMDIPNYASTALFKDAVVYGGSQVPGGWYMAKSVQWRSLAALNRETFTPSAGSWGIGSRFTIEGRAGT